MSIKLRKDFKNLKNEENCLIRVKDDYEFEEFKIAWWCNKTPFGTDVEGEGKGFYSADTNSYDEIIFKKQEDVLGFLKLEEIEV